MTDTVEVPAQLVGMLAQVRGWAATGEHPAGLSSTGLSSAGLDPAGMTAEERASWLVGLRQLVDAAEAVFTDVLASFDAQGDAELVSPSRSSAGWLKHQLRLAGGDAAARVGLARAARGELAPVVEMTGTGQVTFDQAKAIAQAVKAVPPAARTDAVALLVDLAGSVDAGSLRATGRYQRHVVDPDGALAQADTDFDRRHLHLSTLLDGVVPVDGILDAEGAAVLQAAFAPFLTPTGPLDTRTTDQRRADALVDIAKACTDHHLLDPPAGRPHLDVLVPLRALQAAATPHPNPATTNDDAVGGAGSRWASGLMGEPASWQGLRRQGGYLTPATLARVSCDATLARVLLSPDALPLELGRTTRLFTRHQRRYLALRDGGCRFPGCDRTPGHTDAHHLHSWLTGGPTDVANAILLCRYHHRAVHEGTVHQDPWTITADDPARGPAGTLWFTHPRGHHPSHPRGP